MLRSYITLDKYELLTPLKDTDTCSVYIARHKFLGTLRVIKSINKQLCVDFRSVREAHILNSLSHPSIPVIYDIEEDDTYIHIIEEFIEGESLQSRISSQIHLSYKETLTIAIQICDIITYT